MTDLQGRFAEGVHVFPVRIYYEDTDAGGVVYYANYLRFAERARTEMLRALGVEGARLADTDGVAFAVRHCAADFVRPARLDDLLEVRTRLLGVGGASLRAEQTVFRGAEPLVRLELKLACTGRSGRTARMPKDLRSSLEGICNKKVN